MLWAALGVMVKHDGVLLRHPQAKKPPAVRACKAPCANVQCVCVCCALVVCACACMHEYVRWGAWVVGGLSVCVRVRVCV